MTIYYLLAVLFAKMGILSKRIKINKRIAYQRNCDKRHDHHRSRLRINSVYIKKSINENNTLCLGWHSVSPSGE